MMLDEKEPMKFHKILHFENLLKSDVHLEFQCGISQPMDILQKKVSLLQKLVATLHSLFDSKTQKLLILRLIPFYWTQRCHSRCNRSENWKTTSSI